MSYTYRIKQMDGKYFYEMANSQLNNTDRRIYLASLTAEQKLLYTRYGNKVRQQKFNSDTENKKA